MKQKALMGCWVMMGLAFVLLQSLLQLTMVHGQAIEGVAASEQQPQPFLAVPYYNGAVRTAYMDNDILPHDPIPANRLRQTHDCVTAVIAPIPTSTPTMTATPTATATQPESPLPTPTRTPWAPSPPPVATPTAIPLVVPQDNRGIILYYSFDPLTHESGMSFIRTDSAGHVSGEAEPWPWQLRNAPDRFSRSPDGKFLATVSARLYKLINIFDLQSGQQLSSVLVEEFFGWHADSQHVLFRRVNNVGLGRGLWQMNVITEAQRPLLLSQGMSPFWLVLGATVSNQGQRLAYATNEGIWLAHPNGSNAQKQLSAVDVWDWSHDDRYIVYSGEAYNQPKTDRTTPSYALWVWDTVTGDRWPIQGPFRYGYGAYPVLSPTGPQLAFRGYVNDEPCLSGKEATPVDPHCRYRGSALFVAELATGAVTRIADHADQPVWSPAGSAILYSKKGEANQSELWIEYLEEGQSVKVTDGSRAIVGFTWLAPLPTE